MKRRTPVGTRPAVVLWRAVGALAAVTALGVMSLAIAVVNPCDGTVGGTYVRWSSSTSSTGPASLPAHDTSFPFVSTSSRAYFVQGRKLLAFRNVSDAGGSAGTKAWEFCNFSGCLSGGTFLNFPSPVPMSTPALHGAAEFLYVGHQDGQLFKINAVDGSVAVFADTRRYTGGVLTCQEAPGDAVNATPAVVLYNFAPSTPRGLAFKNDIDAQRPGDDVVIVITANGCGDTTRNRIIAYWASDLTVKWIFNSDGVIKVDRGTEGCTIDYQNMRLFCGTDLADSATGQNSLFALDIITGALLWSHDAGAILNRPMLNFSTNRLYVANKPGSLMAYDPAGNGSGSGQPLWASPLQVASTGTIVSRSPAVESRTGTWQNKILVLDTGGTLHAVQDNGSSGSVMWDLAPESGVQYRSLPVVLPGAVTSHAFVGRDDGTLQMIELGTTAKPKGAIYIQDGAPSGVDVYDPSIDFELDGSPRVVVASGTTVKRLSVPLCVSVPF